MTNKQEIEGVEPVGELPIQLELFHIPKVARPEYNIGKNANLIFASPYARDLYDEKIEEKVFTQDDGTEVRGSLTITPLKDRKRPTTTTLRIFLGLIQMWELQGRRPDGKVNFSTRQFAHVLGYKWQGKHTADKIAEHLEILTYTKIEFVFSFIKPDGQVVDFNDPINIISSGRYIDFKKRPQSYTFKKLHEYTLHPGLVENMLAGHVRPINYEIFITLKNDVTASLYSLLDLYLAKKPKWERRSLPLLMDELGYQGERYKSRRARHAKLKELVRELDGKELLHGKLDLSIEETADGQDWKLVARKIKRIEPKKRQYIEPLHDQEEAENMADDLIEQMQRISGSGVTRLRRDYLVYLCRFIPQKTIQEAWSIARADYVGGAKKGVVAVFVGIVKSSAKERGHQLPTKK